MLQPDIHQLTGINRSLSSAVAELSFDAPVTHVYNPLDYAAQTAGQYLEKYGQGPKKVLFLGMNPGPYGMAQTGVPFGEVAAVRDWLGITGQVGKPENEHPSRPVDGFDCQRSEVSGARLWGFFRDEFGEPGEFFRHAFVWNYCPLLFSEIGRRGGKNVCRNLTPDKISSAQRRQLFLACDTALLQLVEAYRPRYLVGVGAFAESCLRRLFSHQEQLRIERMLHPSPASPLANRDFAATARRQLLDMGLWELLGRRPDDPQELR